jgi:hypothetical protein
MDRRIVIATVLVALALSAFIGAGLDGVGEARPAGPDLTPASAVGTTMSGDFAATKYAAADLRPASSASECGALRSS